MQTGDGLLARITPSGATIPFDALTALCGAARRHGNGVIEITARGSMQIRGLTPASASGLADAVAAIDIEVTDGVPVAVNPLAGLETDEAIDAGVFARALREAILAAALKNRLAPKVAVAIDAGVALHLDAVAADVRLRAEADLGGPRIHVLLGGDAASARHIGAVAPNDAVEAAMRLLAVLAARGPAARARSVLNAEGVTAVRAVVADLVMASPSPPSRPRCEPIGLHPLRDGRLALGIGLAFGHTDADALERLAKAASDAQACGIRTAPDRALLFIGVAPERAGACVAIAEDLGFVTRASDPRRSIAACPGAPLCACTETPTRALAPAIATAAASMLDGSLEVHLSGCVKSCAHSGAAPLTIVGGKGDCGIIVNGPAQEQPSVTVPSEMLAAAFGRLARAVVALRRPDERAAAVLSRLGAARVAAILAERLDG
jgi:precorrin-3B synthase